MARRARIPCRVRLGLHHTVSVRCVTPSRLAEILEEKDRPKSERSTGCWIVDDATIYINSTLSLEEKWKTYLHELLHAIHDILCMLA